MPIRFAALRRAGQRLLVYEDLGIISTAVISVRIAEKNSAENGTISEIRFVKGGNKQIQTQLRKWDGIVKQ